QRRTRSRSCAKMQHDRTGKPALSFASTRQTDTNPVGPRPFAYEWAPRLYATHHGLSLHRNHGRGRTILVVYHNRMCGARIVGKSPGGRNFGGSRKGCNQRNVAATTGASQAKYRYVS